MMIGVWITLSPSPSPSVSPLGGRGMWREGWVVGGEEEGKGKGKTVWLSNTITA